MSYETPLQWVEPISNRLGGFDLDPCASASSEIADTNIRESGGLSVDWEEYGTVWVNHPFARGEPAKWLRAASNAECETVVTLSKCDPSTDWFQRYYPQADIWFFPNSRIAFGDRGENALFPVVYGVWGECPPELEQWFSRHGVTVQP
jgi:hypothetical protein